jgi:hypothetical protein
MEITPIAYSQDIVRREAQEALKNADCAGK